jgi:uncharacterized membrane protein YjfL (UPF0719 family)
VEQLLGNLTLVILGIPYFILLLVSLLLGKLFYDLTTPYHFDEELVERDNPAFGVLLALYLIGLMIAIGGALSRGIDLHWVVFGIIAGFCLLCVVLMRLSVWINDTLLLYKFSIDKEIIRDRNAGTGFVVGGGSVATGLMINGSLSVSVAGGTWTEVVRQALVATLVFFALGQALLIVGAWVFTLVCPYDIHGTIEKDDNLAAGLSFGGFLVALGLIVRSALMNAGPHLAVEAITAVAYAALGLVLLLAARVLVDRLLLRKSPLAKEVAVDRNPAAGAVAAAAFICIALAFSWATTAPLPQEAVAAVANEVVSPVE